MDKLNLYNIQAEQTILGMLLLNDNDFWKIQNILVKDHFYEPAHQVIYEHIEFLIKKSQIKPDSVSLKSFFDNDELLKTIGGSKYLSILLSFGAGQVDIINFSKIVIDLYKKRLLFSLGENILSETKENVDKIVVENLIRDVSVKLNELQEKAGFKNRTVHLADCLIEELDELQQSLKDKSYKTKNFIKTGLIDFDRKFKGFKRGEIIVLAGRPSMGKSTVSLAITKNIVNRNYKCIFFSLEMTSNEMTVKLISNFAKINSENIDTGQIVKSDFDKIIKNCANFKEKDFWINDKPKIGFEYIRSILERFKRKEKSIDFIVIDYLQLMSCSKKTNNKHLEISEIMKSLKAIAKDFNCVVLVLSQLNRGVESRENKRPFMQDLKESGSIEEDANMVIFVYREVHYLKKDLRKLEFNTKNMSINSSKTSLKTLIEQKEYDCELIVAKNRRGKTGTCLINFNPKYSQINDYTPYYNNKINYIHK